MLKTILIAFLLLLSFNCLQAQKDYETAYIVNLQGDSIPGFIDYRNWNTNPSTIRFKKTLESEHIPYDASDINSFMVHQEVYISSEVEVEISPRDTDHLRSDRELKLEKRKVFLMVLIDEEKSLFYYKDKQGQTNFYIKMDGDFVLLVYKKFLMDNKGAKAIGENKKYIGQLRFYLDNCPQIESSLQQATYSAKSLTAVYSNYYENCKGKKIQHIQEIDKSIIRYGMLAGVSITKVDFESNIKYLNNSVFPKSTNFTGGVFLEVIFNRSREKLSLNNELIYHSFSTESHLEDAMSQEYVSFAGKYITLNNMFRYRHPIGSTWLFGNMGVSNGILIQSTNLYQRESGFNSMVTVKNALEEIRKYEFGGYIGAGVVWNKVSFEYRYQISNGISAYLTTSSWTRRSFFFLSYSF